VAEAETAFNETEELELASRALDAVDTAALDRFIAALVRHAQRRSGKPLDAQASTALTRYLRSVARQILTPANAHAALSATAPLHPRVSRTRAARMFGIETEGLSNEDAELEVARRFVRFGGSAARRIPAQPRRAPLQRRVRAAVVGAARRHAPGLIPPTALPPLEQVNRPGQRRVRYGRHVTIVNCCPQCRDAQSTPEQPAAAPEAPPAADSTPKENAMHDIDRTQTKLDSELEFGELEGLELGSELEFGQELEQQEYGQELGSEIGQELEYGQEIGETELQGDMEGVFSEAEEMELASELLGVASEGELDMFLGKLLKKAWRGVRKTLGPVAGPLGGILRGLAKTALPLAGRAAGTFFGGPLGGTLGGKLGSALGNALEMEGLQQEDREFETARRVVQVAGTAAAQAANAPPTSDPQNAAKQAVMSALRRHVPGIGGGYSGYSGVRGRSGRWIRRGNKIVLFGL
jgi:hypothetical protein